MALAPRIVSAAAVQGVKAWVRPTDRDWVTRLQATYKEANRNDMLAIADPKSM